MAASSDAWGAGLGIDMKSVFGDDTYSSLNDSLVAATATAASIWKEITEAPNEPPKRRSTVHGTERKVNQYHPRRKLSRDETAMLSDLEKLDSLMLNDPHLISALPGDVQQHMLQGLRNCDLPLVPKGNDTALYSAPSVLERHPWPVRSRLGSTDDGRIPLGSSDWSSPEIFRRRSSSTSSMSVHSANESFEEEPELPSKTLDASLDSTDCFTASDSARQTEMPLSYLSPEAPPQGGKTALSASWGSMPSILASCFETFEERSLKKINTLTSFIQGSHEEVSTDLSSDSEQAHNYLDHSLSAGAIMYEAAKVVTDYMHLDTYRAPQQQSYKHESQEGSVGVSSRGDDSHSVDDTFVDTSRSQQASNAMPTAASRRSCDLQAELTVHLKASLQQRRLVAHPEEGLATKPAEARLEGSAADASSDTRSDTRASLCSLASRGKVEGVRARLLGGDKVDERSEETGWTALFHAVVNGHVDVVDLLLEHNADLEAHDQFKDTVLHHAARGGDPTMVALLLNSGACKDAYNESMCTALQMASVNAHLKVVKLLLDAGADVNTRDKLDQSSSHLTAAEGHAEVLEVLVKHGGDVNIKDKYGRLPIHYAAFFGHTQVLSLLLAHSSLESIDLSGDTALHKAARQGHVVFIDQLLSAGANKDAVNKSGQTALHRSATGGHEGVLWALLVAGVDVNAADNEGHTALHQAAAIGHELVVDALLIAGADPDANDDNGNTALHAAAKAGHGEIVEKLAMAGTSLAAQSTDVFKGEWEDSQMIAQLLLTPR